MCLIDDGEYYEVASGKTVQARKAYRCDECAGPISPGDEYYRHKGLTEGSWDLTRQCKPCIEGPCAWLTAQCGGFCFHGVHEDLAEHWNERHDLGVTDAEIIGLGRLLIEMRRRRGRVASRGAS